jgi:hypothetical protein
VEWNEQSISKYQATSQTYELITLELNWNNCTWQQTFEILLACWHGSLDNKHTIWIWIPCLRSNEPCAVIAGPLPPNANTVQNAVMEWIKLKVSSRTVTLQQMREMLGTLRLHANFSNPGNKHKLKSQGYLTSIPIQYAWIAETLTYNDEITTTI